MAWTDPKTWRVIVSGAKHLVDASELNEQLKDNQQYLKGLDGPTIRDNALELKDMDGTPVGNLRLKVAGGILQIRNATDDADKKLGFNHFPTGTGATEIAIGNHTH